MPRTATTPRSGSTPSVFGVGFDWRIFKAQGLTESRLDPAALSGVGARGIMQLMPSTFREIQSKNPEWSSVDDVEWNIAAGIFHDRQLWRLWRDEVHDGDHHRFMFASYNAGRVPILTAQLMARKERLDPRAWTSVEAIAPKVPRWRHRETVTYVARIWENLGRLDARGRVAPGRAPPGGLTARERERGTSHTPRGTSPPRLE